LRVDLDHLRQNGSGPDAYFTYVHDFKRLVNRLTQISETEQMLYFINGLQRYTQSRVQEFCPSTLEECMQRASAIECNQFRYNKSPTKVAPIRHFSPKRSFSSSNHTPSSSKPSASATPKTAITCFKCKQHGHYSNVCTNREKKFANLAHAQKSDKKPFTKENNLLRPSQRSQDKVVLAFHSTPSLLTFPGSLNSLNIRFTLDTGASPSVISASFVRRHNIHTLNCAGSIVVADGSSIQYSRRTDSMKIRLFNHVCNLSLIVTELPEDIDALLGLDWFALSHALVDPANRVVHFPAETHINDLETSIDSDYLLTLSDPSQGTYPLEENFDEESVWDFPPHQIDESTLSHLPSDEKATVIRLLHYNDDVFVNSYGTIGCCTLQPFKIETTTETPVVIPPYRKSFKERELIKQEIEKMIDANIIVPSISRLAAPVVLIPKPDGSIRFCVDYRGLNKITIADPFPLPRVDEILEAVAPASIFSLLDVQKCFWQVILDPKFASKTAFRTQDGHYEFTRIPFGLKNAPAACVRLMNRQLGDLNFVRAYMDDICVFSSSFNEHIDHLLIVFDRLFLSGIKLNWAKCFFFQHRIAILGHIIEHNKIMMNPLKIDKIRDMTPPKSIKELHRLMGLFSYYRRYIKNLHKSLFLCTNCYKRMNLGYGWNLK
jgi:hypothetical protein